MLTAVVTYSASAFTVSLQAESLQGDFVVAAEEEGAETIEVPESDLNPIFPEFKEVIWGFGSFVVFALVLRLFLFRKVRDGMSARYDHIQSDFADADALTAAARSDVADYEASVAALRAEAQVKVETARATLEAERSARLTEVNARIAEQRSAAAAEVEAAKLEARSHVEAAVADVASLAGRLATGQTPSPDAVTAAVTEAVSQGVSS